MTAEVTGIQALIAFIMMLGLLYIIWLDNAPEKKASHNKSRNSEGKE